MAKDTKKSLKESLEKTPKTEEVRKVAPDIPEGFISIAMTKEDMQRYANLLSITAKTFEKLAMEAVNQNDEVSFSILQERHRLSYILAEKFVEACKLPEPISRDIH
jgi:hypothetical protein